MKILNIDDKPTTFLYNNNKVSVFSFFNSKSPVPTIVAEKQLEVFNHFDLYVNLYDANMRHPTFMDTIMKKYESDIYLFFDVDSIPLNKDVFNKILSNINDDTIFGVSQQDNCNYLNHVYAAPSCLCFTNNMYNKLNKPSFVERQRYLLHNKIYKSSELIKLLNLNYKNNDEFYLDINERIIKLGGIALCDVAEELTYVAQENNINIKLWYPTRSLNYIWNLDNGKYRYGNGTIYENNVYHQFQIRNNDQINSFIEKCNEILK